MLCEKHSVFKSKTRIVSSEHHIALSYDTQNKRQLSACVDVKVKQFCLHSCSKLLDACLMTSLVQKLILWYKCLNFGGNCVDKFVKYMCIFCI
jgi:hypothetical protein